MFDELQVVKSEVQMAELLMRHLLFLQSDYSMTFRGLEFKGTVSHLGGTILACFVKQVLVSLASLADNQQSYKYFI